MTEAEKTHEILTKVREIEIRTRRLVDETMAGQYGSVFKGRGMDFDRAREYVRGDEVRTIDWNVTARTGSPHVKVFTEERELTMLLMVDISGSGDFGSNTQTKRELAAEMTSVMAFSALRNNDKVGLILFTDEVELYLPPGGGRRHILRLIREILFFQPKSHGTDISKALDLANRMHSRKTLMFLASDFCLGDDYSEKLEALKPKIGSTSRRHDLVTVAVNDPRELTLPNIGIIRVEDAETGEIITIDTGSKSVREAFNGESLKQRQELRQLLQAQGIDLIEVETGEAYLPKLRHFFAHRQHQLASS
ncbi:DUF58 domain-containing protein [Akkermansiaceae bacterium]|nr:DUF58 domain-containing protein [Akkermansiaceae bacterium]MDA7888362.1 DUF58 domain-containing protein [Akkermansiaceae bacterium]MDB4537376.1 DUF58 domain-containing protein [Akkermansiaceae bacterium]